MEPVEATQQAATQVPIWKEVVAVAVSAALSWVLVFFREKIRKSKAHDDDGKGK